MKHFAIATACLTLIGSAAWAEESVNESAAMKSGKRLEVENKSGTIEVIGWNRDRVEVTGELASDNSELEFVPGTDKVFVKVISRRHRKHGSSDLVIRVPKETHIEITGVSTDIEVSDITGEQQLTTVSGDIDTEIFDDDVWAKTVSGEVEVEGNGEDTVLEVITVSGEVAIENVAGDVHASTTSGDMEITGDNLTRLELSAVSGDIDVEGELNRKARVEVETVNGDVWLDIQDDIECQFDLESFNGSISSIDGHAAKRQHKYGPGRSLEYTRGDGMARVRVNTLNGDIDIRDD